MLSSVVLTLAERKDDTECEVCISVISQIDAVVTKEQRDNVEEV